jgi:hypothetical protein
MMIPNTVVMPAMDQQTFVSNSNSIVNFMSCSMYSKPNTDVILNRWKKFYKMHPKFRYKIKVVAGDYFYEEMSIEETIKKSIITPGNILKSQADIDAYVRDNLNQKLPLDGPLFRLYFAKYDPIDMDHVKEEDRPKSFLIWKCHHSFCDGVSIMSLILALSDNYDVSYFQNVKSVTTL